MNSTEAEQLFLENIYRIKGKVLVILPSPWISYKSEEVKLLSKILNSIKLSLEGVHIISKKETSLEELSIYEPSAILLFGVSFTPTINSFSFIEINSVRIINSDSIGDLNDLKKKSLWGILQQAFKL